MDTIQDNQTSVNSFRDSNVPGDKYGAVYYPHLQTILNYEYEDAAVSIAADSTNSAGEAITDTILSTLKADNSGAYSAVKNEIASSLRVVLAPSSTMAGVYAKVDSTSGVWKAPANVGLNYVVAPTLKISSEDQRSLNVDVNGGKSINAIRTFTGKGTLVWGARTLDGNSNEWRYVSVRRFFNMVEESVKKASERFVFESNDANTWVRVRAMIENFLNTQWRAGALAGASPEEAYFVRIGLGETMSAQDVLEGKMIVEIGMAAVRPAEFIILRFSHKLQES
jgi:phage tail sheath protein FI